MVNEPVVGDRLVKRDYVLAAIVGLLFTGIYLIFAPRGMEPAIWNDLAVAAHLRPPQAIFPAVWRMLAAILVRFFGIAGAGYALQVLGALVGGCCVFLVSLSLRRMLAYLMRVKERTQWSWIAPLVTMLCTISFGTSDAMWRMVAPLTSGAIRFFLFLFSIQLFLHWAKRGGLGFLLLADIVAGFLAAETPIGFLLPVFCYVLFNLVMNAGANGNFQFEGVLVDAEHPLPKWRRFFCFLAGFALAMAVNIIVFVHFDGLDANGWNGLDVFFHYLLGYAQVVAGAATLSGWFISLGLCVLPLIGALPLFPRLCRDNEPINFKLGLVMFFAGFVAVVQSSALPFCHLRNITLIPVAVESEFLHGIFTLCTVSTLALSASCFACAAQKRFLYDPEEDKIVDVGLRGVFMRFLVPALMVVFAIPSILRIYRPVETELRAIVDDALAEIVQECGDAKYLFTDGHYDAGIELKAAQMGSHLRTLNLFSGSSPWEKSIRTRYFEPDSPDYFSAAQGVPVLLRVWAGERVNGMAEAATQVGFEFWRRARKPLPEQSGFVARTKGFDEETVKRGKAVAMRIAQRILLITKRHSGTLTAVSPMLREAIYSLSWRISRFARMRDDVNLANALDESNSVVRHLMDLVEYERSRTFMQLTPYEGLRLALHRANFAEARRFGSIILQVDPDDPEANFGTGMAYLLEEKLKDAEVYLERVLKTRPGEPAVLNNLSIVYRKAGQLEKALEYAKKAYAIVPENKEVEQTLRETEKIIRARQDMLKRVFSN